MVGWLSPRPAVKSQTQIGASAFHREAIMGRRAGSASAFIKSEVWFAQLSFTFGSSQQVPRSRSIGSSLMAIAESYAIHRHVSMDLLGFPPIDVYQLKESSPMSDVKEAVRSRYAGVAKQLAVLQGDPGAGCCQADGPDCGCSGSYSADELS